MSSCNQRVTHRVDRIEEIDGDDVRLPGRDGCNGLACPPLSGDERDRLQTSCHSSPSLSVSMRRQLDEHVNISRPARRRTRDGSESGQRVGRRRQVIAARGRPGRERRRGSVNHWPMWFVDIDRQGTVERVVVRGERSTVPRVPPRPRDAVPTPAGGHGIPFPRPGGATSRRLRHGGVPGRPDFAGSTPSIEPRSSTTTCTCWRASIPFPSSRSPRRNRAGHIAGRCGLAVGAAFERGSARRRFVPTLMEFVLGWLRPSAPSNREAPRGGLGQFHHDGSERWP
jgi:hypothetical protein